MHFVSGETVNFLVGAYPENDVYIAYGEWSTIENDFAFRSSENPCVLAIKGKHAVFIIRVAYNN